MDKLDILNKLAQGDSSPLVAFPVVSICLFNGDGTVDVTTGKETTTVNEKDFLKRNRKTVLVIDLADTEKGQS